MALSKDKKAYLQHLADAGDLLAKEALALESTGRAGFASVGTPAAKSATAVHAAVFGDASGPVTVTSALTNPAFPRNVSAVAGATYDGGIVTVTGTDQFGNAQTEAITPVAGSTVYGAKVFKTVTSVAYPGGGVGTHSTNTLSIGTGDKLGLAFDVIDTFGLGIVNGAPEAVTMDATANAATFTSVPDGSKVFKLLCNL